NVDILSWKKRLSRVMHHPGTSETKRMLNEICKPAVQAVADELEKRAVTVDVQEVELEEDPELYHSDITIHLEEEQ
ncbi:high-affinity choline transporter BetT, partial [Acinetobacter baumannii]